MKKVRRKRFNIWKFLFVLLFLYIIVNIFIYLFNLPIKNIVVLNSNYLSDEQIIETAKTENYPSFIRTLGSTIEKRLKKLDLVNDVKVKKEWGFVLKINITEEKILYQERSTGLYVLGSNKTLQTIDNINGIPVLINFVPDDVLTKMNESFNKLSQSTICKISEIEYSPTTYDDERFLLYMNDKNLVYITLSKIENLNKYVSIKEKLNNKTGILYLDSGNYFEIK